MFTLCGWKMGISPKSGQTIKWENLASFWDVSIILYTFCRESIFSGWICSPTWQVEIRVRVWQCNPIV